MRVAILSANVHPGDAIGNQVAAKCAFFLDRGAEVRIFVEDARRVHPAARPHCEVVPRPKAHGPVWDFLLSADLVLVEFSQYFALLELLPLLAERRIRLVVDYHGITPPALWGSHNREALDQGLRQRGLVWCAEAAVVHSCFAAAELCEPTHYPANRVHRLRHPAGIDAPTTKSSKLRQKLGLEDATLLLFVGRIAANKRLPVLVEALACLRNRMPAVHAVIVGDDSDLYRAEADRSRALAHEGGVSDRVHFLGHVSDERLREAYAGADIFVMPSRHEGYCIPVVEAMTYGVPVVAARAAALPETVGNAGLTFAPDDAKDLARQLGRVLDSSRSRLAMSLTGVEHPLRIVVVTEHFSPAFVGGAETSLRRMCETLRAAGHHVEVFTTDRAETAAPITVHSFTADPRDPARQAAALQQIEQTDAAGAEAASRDFLAHAVHSTALIAALHSRAGEFDAILTGPYPSGLALDTAAAFPTKTVLVPCFHDEPAARLGPLLSVYREVSGILYHSPEEQELAEAVLGLNVPGAVCAGTLLDVQTAGNPERGQRFVGTGRRYLLCSGRYTPHKELPRLLDFAARYTARHPERFTFAFSGRGELSVPEAPWARDLGCLDPADLRDVTSGAAAVIQLSRRESLSLTALEAWAQGVPVIADAGCPVLSGHIERGHGGRLVSDFESFAATLDDLWEQPDCWHELGQQGQQYVRTHYACPEQFRQRLELALDRLTLPLAERMRRCGRERAEASRPERWRESFGRLVEEWLHRPQQSVDAAIEIQPREAVRTVAVGQETTFVPVRLVNRGNQVIAAEGPARVVVLARLLGEEQTTETPLPALLVPGQTLPLAVRVPVPRMPGDYQVSLWIERIEVPGPLTAKVVCLSLRVEERVPAAPGFAGVAELVQGSLAAAERLKTLPDDYLDVTEGWFAGCKRWLKRKLLNNFKRAYVDVVVRQQSAFNQHILTALHELAERCTALENAREKSVHRAPAGERLNEESVPQEEVSP